MTCLKPEDRGPAAGDGSGPDFNPFDAMAPRLPAEADRAARNGQRVKTNDVAPSGVYKPNYNILTPHMRSPDYVQMSTAAAITLGIMNGKMHRCACTRCLNLLLTYPEGCRANCAYCGLARHREAERDYYLERLYPSFGNLSPRDISSRRAKQMVDEGKGVSMPCTSMSKLSPSSVVDGLSSNTGPVPNPSKKCTEPSPVPPAFSSDCVTAYSVMPVTASNTDSTVNTRST